MPRRNLTKKPLKKRLAWCLLPQNAAEIAGRRWLQLSSSTLSCRPGLRRQLLNHLMIGRISLACSTGMYKSARNMLGKSSLSRLSSSLFYALCPLPVGDHPRNFDVHQKGWSRSSTNRSGDRVSVTSSLESDSSLVFVPLRTI